jgi:hypothetical protein
MQTKELRKRGKGLSGNDDPRAGPRPVGLGVGKEQMKIRHFIVGGALRSDGGE